MPKHRGLRVIHENRLQSNLEPVFCVCLATCYCIWRSSTVMPGRAAGRPERSVWEKW